jgi:hypothetical protein
MLKDQTEKYALGLYLYHMFTLSYYAYMYKKGGNKGYIFCLATCNEACLGYMGILTIGPFN